MCITMSEILLKYLQFVFLTCFLLLSGELITLSFACQSQQGKGKNGNTRSVKDNCDFTHTLPLIESCEVNYSKMLTRSKRRTGVRGAAVKQLAVSQPCKAGQADKEGTTGV